jgi:predicted TIM-barrel fold metal-dependent hydrolase
MTYTNGRIVHDADSHVMETPTWLEGFVEPEHKELAGAVLGDAAGLLSGLIDKAKARKSDADADKAAAENPISGAKGWSAYGAFDAEERSKVLDQLGFSGQLVFPTAGLRPAQTATDSDKRYAGSRAYNKSIAAFCAGDPRLLAVGFVPLDDPERARAEAEHAIDLGCAAVLVSSGPAGERSPGHPLLDPVWALLCERDIPFMLHIGSGTKTQPKAFRNNGRPRAPDLHGGGENLRFCDYIMLWYAPQVFLTAMIYDGVFDRFPKLRGGVIESGAGWVPDFLRQLDLAYQSFSRTDPYLKQLAMKPSEYLRRSIKFTPFPGEDVGLMIKDAGPELFMFSSDYPHPEGTKDPLGRFERTLEGLDEAAKDKFYRRNFEEMMGARASA